MLEKRPRSHHSLRNLGFLKYVARTVLSLHSLTLGLWMSALNTSLNNLMDPGLFLCINSVTFTLAIEESCLCSS